MSKLPIFCGSIGANGDPEQRPPFFGQINPRPIWHPDPRFRLYAEGAHLETFCAWHSPPARGRRPSVFSLGSIALSTDTNYGIGTSLRQIQASEVPDVVANLYQQYGTEAFARLEGNFSLVVWDPIAETVYLVIDKYGCEDVFFRDNPEEMRFASAPFLLADEDSEFDPLPMAFLLAQEGFIPAPFSAFPQIKAVGRSRYLRLRLGAQPEEKQIARYWYPGPTWNSGNTKDATDSFFELLKTAASVEQDERSAVLLGGADSSLLFNIAASKSSQLIAITGTVRGYLPGEQEIERAQLMAAALGAQHEAMVIDPADESLPDDWLRCARSIETGVRLGLPVWLRYARRLRERLGEGYTVMAGQLADTFADNNFTMRSAGYTMRRALFSPWFLRLLPKLHEAAPRPGGMFGQGLTTLVNAVAGPRWAGMFSSLLNGLDNPSQFYDGRVFGYGEIPGRSPAYFPMLAADGFRQVADWYSSHYVSPIFAELRPDNFYRQMIEMSLDMVMLHLDSRLLFQLYRLEGGQARLPFMDTRIVNFLGSMPYSARALYREPKHIIRAQLRRPGMVYKLPIEERKSSAPPQLPEEMLLNGSLGAYFRELLKNLTFPDRCPQLFNIIDEEYLQKQITGFRRNEKGVNSRYLARLAAVEVWSRGIGELRKNSESVVPTSVGLASG
jgi:asparagine synthase (glutamine-hydrolysing)